MNIQIRKFRSSDTREFYEAIVESIEHVSKWLPWCHADYTIGEARFWVESAEAVWANGTDYRFVIEHTDSCKLLGTVGINQIVKQHKIGNLGYWVRKSALNQGVCQQAAKLAIQYAFSELDLKRIEIHVLKDNIESNHVASKLGGVFEGTMRNKLFYNGKPMDANCYCVIPGDFEI